MAASMTPQTHCQMPTINVPPLGLTPLKLLDKNLWDPTEEYWGEEGEAIMDCFKPIIDGGPRPSFEMEQILPGFDSDDPDSDPIGRTVDLYEAGDVDGSIRVLHQCLEEDLRVLDAHAHLGNWSFRAGSRRLAVERAQKNYEAGVAIGELSLGRKFRGVLRWGQIDNRPFLRCLHGLGLCRWAAGDLKGAREIFERMLWLNPSDNQGARFCLAEVAAGTTFEDSGL
jgi:tetratricopeptide (TPR) repeat protein